VASLNRLLQQNPPEAVMPFSFAVTFRFEVMGTRGRLTDYHVFAKNSRGGPAETDL
jgi:hypothetical protein